MILNTQFHQNLFDQINIILVKTLLHNIPKVGDEPKGVCPLKRGGGKTIACYL